MSLLKQRNFVLLWLGYFVSLLGDWVLDVALPIFVYRLTGSGTLLGTMVALEAIPGIVLAPVAGVLIDRWDKRKVLIWTNMLLGLSVLLLFFVQSQAQLWLIFLVGLLNAVLGTFLYPARSALVPDIVAEAELIRANSIMTTTLQGSRLFGPALGGAIIGLYGPSLAFSLDAVTFFFAALCLFAVHAPRSALARPENTALKRKQSVLQELLAGFQVIGSTPLLWATLVVWSILLLAGGAVTALMVVFVKEALHGSEASMGYLLSIQGLGMVIGGGSLIALGKKVQPVPAIIGGIFLSGMLFLVGANSSSLLPAAVALFGLGITMAVSGISIRTIFQTIPPPEFRGRVLASNDAIASLMIFLGAGIAGVMSDIVGVRVVMNMAGLLLLGASLVALILLWPNRMASRTSSASTTT